MFCATCGCQLPEIAKFCVRCGSQMSRSGAGLPAQAATPQMSAAQDSDVVRPRGSFCVNCGKAYVQSYKFCNYCGYQLPFVRPEDKAASPGPAHVDISSTREESTAVVPAPVDTAHVGTVTVWKVPYAAFTLWFLASTLSTSCALFALTYAIVRERLGIIDAVVVACSLLACPFVAVAMKKTWGAIASRESPIDIVLKRRRRRTLIKAGVFLFLFASLSTTIGFVIAQNGAEASQVLADLVQMRTIGDRISKARTPKGDEGITWYINMYRLIEPDVKNLGIIVDRLISEYPSYADKFPDHDSGTSSKTMSDLNTTSRRIALLEQEIAVAKTMDGLNEAAQQALWRNEMYPLLKQEDDLDQAPK